MPGRPAETMIGVGAVGFGVLLLYGAVKNKNPFSIIKDAVTTGKLSSGSTPLGDTSIGAVARNVERVSLITIINQRVQDPQLRQDATNLLSNGTGDASSIIQRMQDAGETDIASSMASYLNVAPPTGTGGGGGGKAVID